MARSETGTATGTSTGTGGAQAPGSKRAASSTACTEGESSQELGVVAAHADAEVGQRLDVQHVVLVAHLLAQQVGGRRKRERHARRRRVGTLEEAAPFLLLRLLLPRAAQVVSEGRHQQQLRLDRVRPTEARLQRRPLARARDGVEGGCHEHLEPEDDVAQDAKLGQRVEQRGRRGGEVVRQVVRREAGGQAELVHQRRVAGLHAHRALELEDLVVGRERVEACCRIVEHLHACRGERGREQGGRVGLELEPAQPEAEGGGRPAGAARPVLCEERGAVVHVRAQHRVREAGDSGHDDAPRAVEVGRVGQAEAGGEVVAREA
eukprot:scaffold18892_cov64-Phaeocystis_antarctica.AAC.3